jgi:hypothetical protein
VVVPGVDIYGPARAVKEHSSGTRLGQMQSYIRLFREGCSEPSSPDEICASPPDQLIGLARPLSTTLSFSQFVEGCGWCPWAREGVEEARVFAGDELCHGEEIRRASARFDALQSQALRRVQDGRVGRALGAKPSSWYHNTSELFGWDIHQLPLLLSYLLTAHVWVGAGLRLMVLRLSVAGGGVRQASHTGFGALHV